MRKKENILDVLVGLPWWVSVLVSALVYLVLKFVLPLMETNNMIFKGLQTALPPVAHYLALILLLPAPLSALNAWRKRRLLDSQNSIVSVRALSWKEFEELVAEAYRRKGFTVIENQGAGADGGVDLRLKKDGCNHLVQCKQWRSQKVGVSTVREMYGLMMAEHATSAIIVCSGGFTQEAYNFAMGKPIDLVDGAQLATLIGQLQQAAGNSEFGQIKCFSHCPRCGSKLLLRTARKGFFSGRQFLGCSAFPKCRFAQDWQ